MKITNVLGLISGGFAIVGAFFAGQTYHQKQVEKTIKYKIDIMKPVYEKYGNELEEKYKVIDQYKDDEAWMDDYKDTSSMVTSMGTRIFELEDLLTKI